MAAYVSHHAVVVIVVHVDGGGPPSNPAKMGKYDFSPFHTLLRHHFLLIFNFIFIF